jgi:hypothetical protein
MYQISLPCLFQIIFQSWIFGCVLCCPCQSLGGYKNRFMMQNQKHACWDLDEKDNALEFMDVFDSSKFCFCDNLWYCFVYELSIILGHYSSVLRALLLGTSCYLIEEGMVAVMIHVYHLCIIFLFLNVFYSSVFFHSYSNCRLSMDESKKETKVKYCAECIVIHYIFSVMYEKNSVWERFGPCLWFQLLKGMETKSLM